MMEPPVLIWNAHGLPHSVAFNDKYFCGQNGYEESMYVSCQGNRLAERFAALDPAKPGTFTIVEAGFGTGLSFCCAWKVWHEHAPASWTLHFISLDKFPLSAEQIERALGRWSMLERYTRVLVGQYKPSSSGIENFDLDQNKVRLTIVFEDVIVALKMIKGQGLAGQGADAIFLNGFAPFKNPDMWSEDVFAGMARLSYAQTTFATFTVAGWVRRGLESQGYTIRKEKGYGTKKHILVGDFTRHG